MVGQRPRHILSLSSKEKRDFINSFDLVFSDCDGVIWHLNEPIKDAGTSVTLLQTAGKQFKFITNNSFRTDVEFVKKFQNAGIKAVVDDIVQTSKSIVSYLKKINFEGLIYCIGSVEFKDKLKAAGYEIIDGPLTIEENTRSLHVVVYENQPVKAVVMDFDFNFSATKLMKADQFLKRKDCIFVVGATDMVVPFNITDTTIGPGHFVKILESTSKKQPQILGKPGKELGELIIDKYSVTDPRRVIFFGDMLEQDIGFGKLCGFQTLLVLTGATTKNDLMKCNDPNEIPDFYADSISDFIALFNDASQ